MANQIRNPKSIQSKSRKHTVKPLGDSEFEVVSGASGLTYIVKVLGNGGASCTCDWATYRPAANNGKSGCSHVVAVYNFIAEEAGRKVMAWGSTEEAERQHRPAIEIGDGVVLTTRKGEA